MLHYHVWFNLKAEILETEGLNTVKRFLKTLCTDGEARSFESLRNHGEPPGSKLPRYHALIKFNDQAHFTDAMKAQAGRGIHAGTHGEIIKDVTDFHVEIFSEITDPPQPAR